jgi:hypothetical protein
METVLINLQNGKVLTYENVRTTVISGNYLILVTKQGEVNVNDETEAYVLTTNEIIDLNEVSNYTVKTKTKNYGKE